MLIELFNTRISVVDLMKWWFVLPPPYLIWYVANGHYRETIQFKKIECFRFGRHLCSLRQYTLNCCHFLIILGEKEDHAKYNWCFDHCSVGAMRRAMDNLILLLRLLFLLVILSKVEKQSHVFSSETSKHKLWLMVIIIQFHQKYHMVYSRSQRIIYSFYTVIFQLRLSLKKWKLLMLNSFVICNVMKIIDV